MIKLCRANLDAIAAFIKTPNYDAAQLSPGIVHIGLGNFHRAHQAWYQHRLFEQGLDMDWGIVGAGVRVYDAQMREKILKQDYLTTLIELDPSGTSAEVISPMVDYLPIENGNSALIDQMAAPSTRIVGLTVTEGGYYIDPASKGFDDQHPDIQHDAHYPDKPKTAFGAIVAALKIRRDKDIGPFTGLCCDNLQGNGQILRQTVVSLARLSDEGLADWINSQCSFPNSMVDCIVPATGKKELALAKELGIDDAVPVTHENFRQWVVEDDFCAGRPQWEKVGVTFTNSVHDYEVMKIRILNGGHQVVSGVGDLLGIETIAEAMQNPQIHAFYQKVEHEEITPHVKSVPERTPDEYVELIDRRFSNPDIVDTTRRVAFDGSSRHPGFVIPTIREGLANNQPVEGLALVSALWARYCQGQRPDGSSIEANDPYWDRLTQQAVLAKSEPKNWLEMRDIYGDLVDQPRFSEAFTRWLNQLNSDGVNATLDTYLAS